MSESSEEQVLTQLSERYARKSHHAAHQFLCAWIWVAPSSTVAVQDAKIARNWAGAVGNGRHVTVRSMMGVAQVIAVQVTRLAQVGRAKTKWSTQPFAVDISWAAVEPMRTVGVGGAMVCDAA